MFIGKVTNKLLNKTGNVL